MEDILELRAEVEELEKRIVFLYEMLDKQLKINKQIIKNVEDLQDKVFQYASATNQNTMALNVIGNMLKGTEEA